MATTINSYSVGFGMDARSYIDGAKISRSETRALIKDIEGARSPTEKYAREQDRLSDAYKKGAIDLGTYNRLLDDKKSKLGLASSSVNLYATAFKTVAVAGAAAIAGGVAFVHHLRDVQAEIDETVKAGAKLGLTFNEISQLRFAAGEIGGMDAATVDNSVKKMLINISKAVEGDPTARDAFRKLGLDAGQLMQAGPVESVKMIADSMQSVNSQADRLAISMEIFGKSGTEFVDTLSAGRAVIEESAAFQEKWNSLTVAQTMGVEANNDAWGRVFTVVDGISTKLAAEFAPAMHLVADLILDSADGLSGVDGTIRSVVDTTVYLVGVFTDLYEVARAFDRVLYNTATLNFGGAIEGIQAALDFSSGEKALQALYDKRFELDQAAAKRQRELDERRKNLLDEDAKDTDSKLDQAEKERLKLIEQESQKRDQMAKTALDAARKEFDEREKRHKQMKADIAKGPGGGMEAGSAEAAKFLADQANAALADKTMPDAPTPGEAELIAEAKRQMELMEEQAKQSEEQIALLRKIAEKPTVLARAR
jgi:hypothetical protein